jgi:hypothetical protein
MKIEVIVTFQHEGKTFKEGEVRLVEDDLGDYFYRAGWVKDLSAGREKKEVHPSETILQVESLVSENIIAEKFNG